MFKVGERVRLTDKCKYLGARYGYKIGDIGVIVDCGYPLSVAVKMENPKNSYIHLWCNASELEYAEKTPPQKITQNGYEYYLVGPVNPEWLVDGAWVVNSETGEKRLVKEERPGVFNLCVDGLASIRYYDGLRNQYRPHEPKDWKWGDWAMYGNDRVFVIRVNSQGTAIITSKSSNYSIDYVPVSELTPTF